MKINWLAKLRNFLQVLGFCVLLAAVQYAFAHDRPYQQPLVYSLGIGLAIWALIDFGRHFFPSSTETGWPRGAAGMALSAGGIVGGYLLGTLAGDAWLGRSSWEGQQGRDHLRNSILITAMAGIAASYYFYSATRSSWLQRKMDEARRHAIEAQLKLLQSQLEPHMLFNTLANLRVLIAVDPPRAQQMLDHVIAYLRATLDGSRATTHPLQAEFDRLRDYLELMAIRMGPRLQYTLDLPAGLAQQAVPTLLLQPLVENSIQHGLEPQVEGGSIAVRARREADALVLEVQDTGAGTGGGAQGGTGERRSDGAGFGLAQVRERLEALYGPAAELDFAAQEGRGARTSIRLPLAP